MKAETYWVTVNTDSGAEFRAYVKGMGVSASCTWDEKVAVKRAARRAFRGASHIELRKTRHGLWKVTVR